MRKLIVTEKFNTALRIAVILSEGRMDRRRRGPVSLFSFETPEGPTTVVGLRGHIVELDYASDLRTWDLTTLPRLLEAEPIRVVTEPAIVEALRELAPQSDRVILATDWDREGEVIAAECLEILREANPHLEVYRAQYSALTRAEILRSFSDLKRLDRNLADAGLARQNVDLMWGALLTRYLTLVSQDGGRRGSPGGFLSVGRVQTPTLALLVERDREIREFQPHPFWDLWADLQRGEESFRVRHTHGSWFERPEASKVYEKLQGIPRGQVQTFQQEESRIRPPVPFNTTLFVAEATKLGFGAAQVMSIAEDLYTQGLISYPRTDNTVYPRTLRVASVLEMLKDGPFRSDVEYCLAQESIRPTRGRTETTDHPPIYPTEAADPKRLRPDRARIYELVVRRFLATVAPEAVGRTRKAEIDIGGETFEGHGFRLVDPGWYRVYPYQQANESDLPELRPGEVVTVVRLDLVEDKTRPPRRYTQGTLLQEMERLGLGTKSTRHEIIQKLFDRHYATARGLEPTASGIGVTEALQAHAGFVTKPDMTSRLEADMDRIAQGEKPLREVIEESRDMLREVYQVLVQNADGVRETLQAALDRQHHVGPCPKCGGALRMMRSPRGYRWVQCANNPRSCTVNYSLPSSGFVEPAGEICSSCHTPKVRITYRGQRPQNYCINPLCEEHQKAYQVGSCPQCGSPLHIRYSAKGSRFIGCTAYPNCRVTYPLPQRGGIERGHAPCEVCRAPVVVILEQGRRPWTLCVNPECPTRRSGKTEDTPAVRGPSTPVSVPASPVSKIGKRRSSRSGTPSRRTRSSPSPRRRKASVERPTESASST